MKIVWKKMLAFLIILTLLAGFAPNISMREVKAAEEVTMTVTAAAAQDSNKRFVITFDVGSAETLQDIYWNNNTVYVDGEAKSGSGVNYGPAGTKLNLYLQYNILEEGVTAASALGKHMIQIPAGTVIGKGSAREFITTNDVWLSVSGSSISAKTPVNFTVKAAANQSGSNRYLITLDVTGTEVTDRFWNNNTGYVNGEAVSTGVNYTPSGSTQLLLCLSYTAFGVSSYTEVTNTVFEIRKGTLLGQNGDCVINNDVVFYINGGSIVEKVPVKLSFKNAANQSGSNRYLIYFNVSGESIPNDNAVWNNNTAYINGVKTSTGVNYARSDSSTIYMCLGYAAFGVSSYTDINNARLEIRERTLMGANYIIMNSSYFDVNQGTVLASVPEEVVTLTDRPTSGATTGNGFYFVTSPTDSYPNDESWGTNIYFSSGGVYVDGEFKNNVYIRKILSNLYYVCLLEGNAAVSANQVVTVNGSIKNNDVKVTFTETSFIFTGSEWNVYTPPTEVDVNITGIVSGQQVNDTYQVCVSADTEIPEAVANNRFLFQITIDGVEKSIYAYRVAGKNQFLLVIETSKLQVKDYAVPIVVKTMSGIETATIPMNIVSEFTFYLYPDNKFYERPEYATTLDLHYGISTNKTLALYTKESDVCAAANQINLNSVFYPVSEFSGIWYNGKQLDASRGFELIYNETSQMNLCLTDLSAVSGDLLTVEGRFLNNGVLLNVAKANFYFNGTGWTEVDYSYEDVTEININSINTAAEQSHLNRWLFRFEVDPALYETSDFAGNYGTFFVNIYNGVNETPATTSAYAYWAKDGMLGLVLDYDLLPAGQDAYNYEIEIPSFILKTGDYIYKFSNFKMKNIVGAWTKKQVYLTSINHWLGDANADEDLDSTDIVRVKRYLADEYSVSIYDGGADANEDGKIDRKDVLKLYEYIFEGFYYEDGKNDSHSVKGIPYYANDQEVFTSAYQGPRAGGKYNYYYTPDTVNNYLYKDGLFSSKVLAGTLKSEYVETSFINEYEFKQYKDAGFTTLVTEGDTSWTNHDKFGLGGGMYAMMKYYMLLAEKVGLDVIVTSTGINAFIGDMNHADCGYTQKADGTELIYTKEYVVEDLTELVSFMNGENNLSQWGINETYVREEMGVPEEYVDAMVNQDIKFDNFVGIQLSDETDYACVEKYNYVAEEMRKLKPDCKFHSSNLLSGRRDGSTDLALETVMDGFANVTGQFTFDEYIFRKQLTTKTSGLTEYGIVGDGYLGKASASDVPWLRDHHNVARLATGKGYGTGATVQSFGMYSSVANKVYDVPNSRGDMAWQVYTALAYGFSEIHYFTYWEHATQSTTGECHTGSMVVYPDDGSTKSVKTDLYGFVQSVNQEMKAYDHIFLDYAWKGTAYTGDNVGVGSGFVTSDDITTDSALASWTSTETGLVSYMYDSEKQLDGFWVVNAEDPNNEQTSITTLTFDAGYRRVMVFQGGKKKIVNLDNHALSLNLNVGEGVFVIAIKEQ